MLFLSFSDNLLHDVYKCISFFKQSVAYFEIALKKKKKKKKTAQFGLGCSSPLKGHWTNVTSSPNFFKKIEIFLPKEVLTWVMTAC